MDLVRRLLAAGAWPGLLACGCGPGRYAVPDLPANQCADVTVDQRATVTVDGHPVVDDFNAAVRNFPVSAACHELTATYSEEFLITREAGVILTPDPLLTAAVAVAVNAANSETHEYKTEKPIAFHILAKPGLKYWVTATFTGDKFLPRVAVFDAADEHVATILPDTPCVADGGGRTAP